MMWTRMKGGLLGALVGGLAGAGIAYAAADEGKRQMPMILAGVGGGVVGGLGGAKLGKRAQFNAWNNANAACPGNNVADWATLQCTAGCPDDSIPVNGKCPGVVPTSNLLGA